MKISLKLIDLVAISSALICAVHCLLVPIILSISTLSSLHFIKNPYIEWVFIFAGLVFALISIWSSFRKYRKKRPLITAVVGFILIGLSRFDFTESWELINTVTGTSLIASAHYFNWKLLNTVNKHSQKH